MGAPEWATYRCPYCRRVFEFPEGTIAYVCGWCRKDVILTEEPDPDEGEWYGDENES